MYYGHDNTPWYYDYNIIFAAAIFAIIVYAYLSGQIRLECLHTVCEGS